MRGVVSVLQGTRKHSLESGRSGSGGCLAVQETYVGNIECLHIPCMYLSVSLRLYVPAYLRIRPLRHLSPTYLSAHRCMLADQIEDASVNTETADVIQWLIQYISGFRLA